jgi:hypothetical protein
MTFNTPPSEKESEMTTTSDGLKERVNAVFLDLNQAVLAVTASKTYTDCDPQKSEYLSMAEARLQDGFKKAEALKNELCYGVQHRGEIGEGNER